MAEKQQLIQYLDCRDTTHVSIGLWPFNTTNAKAIWDAYVGLSENKDKEFAAASEEEVISLIQGFRSTPLHEGLLHLDSSLTILHMLWNDWPEGKRARLLHCKAAMAVIAGTLSARLDDSDRKLYLIDPTLKGSDVPMPVMVRLIKSWQRKVQNDMREVRNRFIASHGEDKTAIPFDGGRQHPFITDLLHVVMDGMQDFGEVKKAIDAKQSNMDVLAKPEFVFWKDYLTNAHRFAIQFMRDVTFIQYTLCRCCCDDVRGFNYIQSLGKPILSVKRATGLSKLWRKKL